MTPRAIPYMGVAQTQRERAPQALESPMSSKLARDLKRAQIAEAQRWTPEERVQAFLAHSRLLAELYLAGQKTAGSQGAEAVVRSQGPGEPALLLLDAVEVLKSHRVPYTLVGALAASVHGAVRGSVDADVLIGASVQEATAIDQAFRSAGSKSVLSRGEPHDDIPAVTQSSSPFSTPS